jgi:hypothetical protein
MGAPLASDVALACDDAVWVEVAVALPVAGTYHYRAAPGLGVAR